MKLAAIALTLLYTAIAAKDDWFNSPSTTGTSRNRPEAQPDPDLDATVTTPPTTLPSPTPIRPLTRYRQAAHDHASTISRRLLSPPQKFFRKVRDMLDYKGLAPADVIKRFQTDIKLARYLFYIQGQKFDTQVLALKEITEWLQALYPEVEGKTDIGKRAIKELRSGFKLGVRDACYAIATRVVAAGEIDAVEFKELEKNVLELQLVFLEFLGRVYGDDMPIALKESLESLKGKEVKEHLVGKLVRKVKEWFKGFGKKKDAEVVKGPREIEIKDGDSEDKGPVKTEAVVDNPTAQGKQDDISWRDIKHDIAQPTESNKEHTQETYDPLKAELDKVAKQGPHRVSGNDIKDKHQAENPKPRKNQSRGDEKNERREDAY